jgi:hypothetical protein
MRYQDLKLVESVFLMEAVQSGLESQHTLHDLQAISKSVSDIPTEKVDDKMTLVSKLEKMANSVTNFVNKLKNKQTSNQLPVEVPEANAKVQKKLYTIKDYEKADERAAAAIQQIKDAILAVNDLPIDDNQKKSIIQQINAPLDNLVKEFEVVRSQRDSARAERDEAIKFVKDVTGILVTLGNKVQGFQEVGDTELASMPSKERTSFKKIAVNAEKFTKTLKQALFGKIIDMQEGSDISQEEIKNFLQACADGRVINMLGVVGTNRGNIKDHVNPEYQKVFNVFVKENIFSYSPGTTSGAIGPGEMALSMMGNPAEKGKKGDLKIGDQEVEIKASATSGGRLNSKSITKATSGWPVWSKHIADILSSAPENDTINVTNKKGERIKTPISKFNGNQYNLIKGKAKLGNKYNWNRKGFDALNEEVLEPYSNFNKTFELFHNTIKTLVQNFNKIENADRLIAAAIEQDGTVVWEKINKAYVKIAYESYHLADGITTIMFLRTDTLDYTIIKDGDDLIDNLFKTVDIGVGFNWNDDQQNPTPGLMATKQKS